jgi:hypothetical protein
MVKGKVVRQTENEAEPAMTGSGYEELILPLRW